MRSATVVLLVKEPTILATLQESLKPLDIVLLTDPDKIPADSYVIVDYKDYHKNFAEKFHEHRRSHLWVISHLTDEENIALIVEHHLHHLIGNNAKTIGQEVSLQFAKMISENFWGTSSYLSSSSTAHSFAISESRNADALLDELASKFTYDDFFDSPKEYLKLTANELISNALYNGPEEKRGNDPKDRKTPVFLKGAELVQVEQGIDERLVALSVQDCFGSLSWERATQSLSRSFREKTVRQGKGGAGLGLYLAFSHANQFVINRRANFRTEVICIIEKNKRYKNYKERVTSFHFFEEAQRA